LVKRVGLEELARREERRMMREAKRRYAKIRRRNIQERMRSTVMKRQAD
jgi:hypothetical protein